MILHPKFALIRDIYKIGIPSIIMISIGSVMTFGMNKILMAFSSTAVAVFGVYFKIESIIFMPVFGMNNAAIPIVGYNLGAGKQDRIRRVYRIGCIYATVFMAGPGWFCFRLRLRGCWDFSTPPIICWRLACRRCGLSACCSSLREFPSCPAACSREPGKVFTV